MRAICILPVYSTTKYTHLYFLTVDLPQFGWYVDGGNVFNSQTQLIFPDHNVHSRLANIKSSDDLKKAQLQSGGLLLDGTSVSDDDIDSAATAIGVLQGIRDKQISQQVTVQDKSIHMMAKLRGLGLGFPSPGKLKRSELICGRNKSAIVENKDTILDMAWVSCIFRL